jgi:hypothetical protein
MAPQKTFPELVRWAADTYHNGVMYQLALRVGISPALADRWSKGLVQRPTMETALKFCRAYSLDPADVLTLCGVSPEVAAFLRTSRRKKVHPIGGGSGDDGTPLVAWWEAIVPLIRRWWRTPWGPGLVWAPAP